MSPRAQKSPYQACQALSYRKPKAPEIASERRQSKTANIAAWYFFPEDCPDEISRHVLAMTKKLATHQAAQINGASCRTRIQ